MIDLIHTYMAISNSITHSVGTVSGTTNGSMCMWVVYKCMCKMC